MCWSMGSHINSEKSRGKVPQNSPSSYCKFSASKFVQGGVDLHTRLVGR